MAGNQDERRRGGEPPQPTATALWRLAPLFEPEQAEPASTPAGGQAAHVATAEAPSRTRWVWLLVAWTATLAVAGTLGFALGSARAGGEAATAAAPRPPATRPAPVPLSTVAARPTASPACLETAKRADEVVHLLIANRRDAAAERLVAFTIASRQCRRDADP
jgi:hypothetical protein